MTSSDKAAEAVARQIELEIIEQRLPPEHRLGSVSDLMNRYAIGRAALREGMRLLEQRGRISMRPGPGGGLFVAGMTEPVVAELLATHIQLSGMSIDEIEEVWELFDELMMRLVADRLTGEIRMTLRNAGQRLQYTADLTDVAAIDGEMRCQLADATGNSAIHLIVRCLDAIYQRLLLEAPVSEEEMPSALERMRGACRKYLQALAKGDLDTATAEAAACRRYRFALVDRVGSTVATEVAASKPLSSLFTDWVRDKLARTYGQPESAKRAEAAALAMAQGIAHFGLPGATALGSASKISAGIGLSDAVFREAVRLLEQHGVIAVVPGRHGGLHVGAPNPERVLEAAVSYLHELGFGAADYGVVREALNAAAGQLAARRVTGSDRRELMRLAARTAPVDFSAFWIELDAFQQILSRCAHNRVLALLHALTTHAISDVSRTHQVDDAWLDQKFNAMTGRNYLEWLWESHACIYRAIADGQPAAALSAIEQHYVTSRQVWVDQPLQGHH